MPTSKSIPTQTARDTQDSSRPSCDGPEFTIKSGAFGGEWSSSRGDLTHTHQAINDED